MKIVNSSPAGTILSAIDKYVEFISPTYGPAGKKILIHDGPTIKAVDDGKMASQDFELEDEHENAIIKYIKETTARTDDRVGDGTTTSAIIMSEIVTSVLESPPISIHDIVSHPPKDVRTEVVALKKGLIEAVSQIKKTSKKVKTKEELFEVTYNSYNNKEIATLVSDTLYKIGKDGSLAIEDSKGMNTECEIVDGLEIAKGYASPYLINRDQEVYIQEPAIVVAKKKLESLEEFKNIVQMLMKDGHKSFAIVAEGFGEQVITATVLNKINGMINPLLVEAPGFGDNKAQTMDDIATITGAKPFDPKTGLKIEQMVFGTAKSVISRKDSTLFVDGGGKKAEIKDRVELLKSQLEGKTNFEKAFLEKRIGQLSGGIAVIRVGAPTENEQRTIKAKTEDAVNATKVALREGIVKGAGRTFESIKTSSEILNKALKAPRYYLERNGVQHLSENVYDPALVLIASLETAVSIACGLIEIGGIITNKREEKKEKSLY